MVLVEAMSFGLPIIASNVGGIPEIIEDGKNGLLVSPASAEALAEAIEKLIEDKQLREKLKWQALYRYNRLPDFEESFERLFYEELKK